MCTFPDNASRILYYCNVIKVFPEFDDFLEKGIFTEKQMAKICEWILPWCIDISHKKAISNIENYLHNFRGDFSEGKIKVGFVPAGGVLKNILKNAELSNVDICGAFDSSIKTPGQIDCTPLFPIHFLQDVELDVLIVSSGAYGREICNQVESYIDTNQVKIYSPYWEGDTINDSVTNEIKKINVICDLSNDQPVLLFVCLRFYSFLYKRLVALKNAGIKVILVALEDYISHTMHIKEVEDSVAYIYSANNNLFNFFSVLKSIRPDFAHFFLNAANSQIPVLASTVFSYPYVVEYNDVLTNMHDRESYARAIGGEESRHEFEAEKYLISHSKGLVYNNHKSAVDHLFKFYGIKVPVIKFLYYPLTPVPEKRENSKGKIRLIFIGGITRSEYGYLCNYSFRDTLLLIDVLTAQNFTVDIYNAYDSGDTNDYKELHEKQNQNSGFKYHKAVHPKDLPEILVQYDAGFIVSDYTNSQMKKDVLERTMSSRLFEYFEAGLPVIISKELQYMASIIEKQSIGVAIGYDQLGSLDQLLTRDKVREYSINIKEYVKTILMKDNIGRLVDFYRSGTDSIGVKQ